MSIWKPWWDCRESRLATRPSTSKLQTPPNPTTVIFKDSVMQGERCQGTSAQDRRRAGSGFGVGVAMWYFFGTSGLWDLGPFDGGSLGVGSHCWSLGVLDTMTSSATRFVVWFLAYLILRNFAQHESEFGF